MATKSKPKSSVKKTSPWKRLLIGAAVVVAALAVLAQFTVDVYFGKSIESAGEQAPVIKSLIVQAATNLMSDEVIEPSAGKVYIPEARLAFRYDPNAPRFQYNALSYNTPDLSPKDNEITVANKQAVQASESKVLAGQKLNDTFDAVPALQACLRQVHLTFQPADSNNYFGTGDVMLSFKQPLADGRTVYAYTEKSSRCQIDSGALVNALKTVQSY